MSVDENINITIQTLLKFPFLATLAQTLYSTTALPKGKEKRGREINALSQNCIHMMSTCPPPTSSTSHSRCLNKINL